MGKQTSFDKQNAEALMSQLQQLHETIEKERSKVLSQWGKLQTSWADEQYYKFQPFLGKFAATYGDAERQLEKDVAFLKEQIRLAEERRQKLGNLPDFGSAGVALSPTAKSANAGQTQNQKYPEKIDWYNLKTTPSERAAYAEKVRQGQHYSGMSQSDFQNSQEKFTTPPPWPEEIAALWFYTKPADTSEGHYQINRLLRGDIPKFENNLQDWQTPNKQQTINDYMQQARFATAALNALPDYKLMAWRQTSLKPQDIAKYKEGDIITEPSFLSSSEGIAEAQKFQGNVLFSILSRTGKQIKNYSDGPHEREVLFRPGTKFKVFSVKQEQNLTKIRLVEVGQDGSEWWK